MKPWIFTILFVACGPQTEPLKPIDLHFVGVDQELVEPLMQPVVDEINAAIGCAALGAGTGFRDVSVEINREKLSQEHELQELSDDMAMAGYWDPKEQAITLMPFVTPDGKYLAAGTDGAWLWYGSATTVLTHEIGHAMGLHHEPGTVMDPYIESLPMTVPEAAASLSYLLRQNSLTPCAS